jgi:AraC-like DNA-binding protein
MAKSTGEPVDIITPQGILWPDTADFYNGELSRAKSPQLATLLPMHAPGMAVRPGSVYRDGMSVDLQWHSHDMHKLLYAFEGAAEVESTLGRNIIPRQLAAWIPAGVPHCTSIHGIRWVSVFFNSEMVADLERRVRTVMVSTLMREMMREAMRWPIDAPDSPIRTSFYDTMAKLCSEWITREADLVLPTSADLRVQRALDYTSQRMDLKISEICGHAGISERSLRRHLKAETGITWEAYRHRSRLLQAISLLSDTDEPISEIAGRCGFDSPSAFAKVFRDTMGEAPREYRNRARDPALSSEVGPHSA